MDTLNHKRIEALLISLTLATGATFMAGSNALANDSVLRLEQDTAAWVNPGGNYANWRYSSLAQINNRNTGKLNLQWSFSTGSLQGHSGGPLILPSYVTGLDNPIIVINTVAPDSVMAIDLVTQSLLWLYEPENESANDHTACCKMQNHGMSYGDRKLFVQLSNHRQVALDARTGRELWQVPTGSELQGPLNVNATTVINDYVLTGFRSFGRNGLAAHNASTGRLVWRAFNHGSPAETLANAESRYYGQRPEVRLNNDPLHSSQAGQIAWDPQQQQIYYVTTTEVNQDPVNQSGLFSTSIHARDASSGELKWHYQLAPGSGLVVSTTGELLLLNVEGEADLIPALVYFANNGFVYVLERTTGRLISADKFSTASNWAALIHPDTGYPVLTEDDNEGPDNMICPSTMGARSHQPSAYSPRVDLFYIQPHQACMRFEQTVMETEPELSSPFDEPGLPQQDQTVIINKILPAPGQTDTEQAMLGSVAAWDLELAEDRWRREEPWPVMSGLLVTAGDVLFYGTLDGYVKAVDAKTGAGLWQFRAPSGITGHFVTWEYKDKQFIAVVSGSAETSALLGGDPSIEIPVRRGGTLLVFSLP